MSCLNSRVQLKFKRNDWEKIQSGFLLSFGLSSVVLSAMNRLYYACNFVPKDWPKEKINRPAVHFFLQIKNLSSFSRRSLGSSQNWIVLFLSQSYILSESKNRSFEVYTHYMVSSLILTALEACLSFHKLTLLWD